MEEPLFTLALQKAQEEQLARAMAAALKDGSVKVKVTLLTMHGAPASGKTSVKDLLLGNPPAKERHSTPVATCAARAIARSKIAAYLPEKGEIVVWEIVGAEELMVMLSESIKKFGENRSSVTPETSQVELDANQADSKQEESDTAQRLLSLLRTASTSDRLQTHWIYMIDSGGQPQFQEVLPLFIRNNSINIVTTKLFEKLSDRPKFEYVLRGKHMCPPSDLQLTNEELIQAVFRSLTSVKSVTVKHAKGHPSKPHFMIIGTFADKASQCEESLKEKNQRLLAILEQYEKVRIDSNPANDEIIFAVNAIATEDREELTAWLRSQITSNEEATLSIDVPIKWFALELELVSIAEKNNSYVLTIQECERAGKRLQVEPDDLKHALVFFSEVAIFLYIPEVLPELVFVTKQPILNKVSDLFSLTFGDARIILKGRQLPPGSQRRLKREGIFTKAVLRCLPDGFIEGLFMEEEFLKMLVHIRVAAPIIHEGGETEYFLPCVLPRGTLPETEKQPFLNNSNPLVITWDVEPVPTGLFPALVVSLLSSQEHPGLSLQKKFSQFRNAVRLSWSLGGAVLLEDKHYWLELCYSGHASQCLSVRTAILKGISEAQKQLHYDTSPPQLGFPCTFCSDSTKLPHLCLVNCLTNPDHSLRGLAPSSLYQMTCTSDGVTTTTVVEPKQMAWLSKPFEGA